ncbi:hypothetical protein [Acinetobacter seifertii]|uniref:hypothetical protein n=1 Tax=Acinetobacter seifertii TaxID=1530123 RepID=UPI000C22D456|nr:hypothetical protein [Acinetobacter seifertii]PJG67804.1 hypothetical protein CVD09_03635 [Acinetobacter seifertii]
MKERPILFNAAMVQSILKGRKTQTRRIVKAKKGADCPDYMWVDEYALKDVIEWREQNNRWFGCKEYRTLAFSDCPYGQIGDRLWVRETFCYAWNEDDHICDKDGNPVWDAKDAHIYYAASETNVEGKWIPSIHMPRHASRILLEITKIRVERLNDISEEDSIAEGVESVVIQDNISVEGGWTRADRDMWKGYKNKERAYRDTAKDSFTSLWQEINGSDSWTQNPWVWVVEFKDIQGGAV